MAKKSKFVNAGNASYYNPKLTSSENESVNRKIKSSWLNGRRSGAKNAYRYLYSKNRIKGGGS